MLLSFKSHNQIGKLFYENNFCEMSREGEAQQFIVMK